MRPGWGLPRQGLLWRYQETERGEPRKALAEGGVGFRGRWYFIP